MVQPINLCCASMYTEDDSEGNTTGTRRVLEKRPHISNIDRKNWFQCCERPMSVHWSCAPYVPVVIQILYLLSPGYLFKEVTKKKYVVFN